MKDRLIGEAVIDLGELHLSQYTRFGNFKTSEFEKCVPGFWQEKIVFKTKWVKQRYRSYILFVICP